jgi:taurine dioxygenase
VVRIHDETGRRGLFVNPSFTSHIKGFAPHESDALLDLLYAHIVQPEHSVRWRWAPGDIAFWDNRATVHYAVQDYGEDFRRVERVTLSGSRPVGVLAA